MPAHALSDFLRRVGNVAVRQAGANSTEAELLGRFVARRDEAAFTALLARYGPLVLGVCRRLLPETADADDAFQATFLVLVRRAASIRQPHLLGSWLHGVACRVARRARVRTIRRQVREAALDPDGAVAASAPPADPDLTPVVQEEVGRLPAKYRDAVVLCYLEGRTHEEAARLLGWPVGTVKGRLARARDLLRSRLTRRGLAGTAVAGMAVAAVPPRLFATTVEAAMGFAAGKAAAGGTASAAAVALAKGALRTMLLARLKLVAAFAVLLAGLAVGTGIFVYRAVAEGPGTGGASEGKEAARPKSDKERIQGSWKVVSVEKDGKEQDDDEAKQIKRFTWDIGPEKITIHQGGFDHVSSYKLDPGAKPRALDLTSEEEAEKGLQIAAVYELKADTLKICSPLPPNPSQRPKEVATSEGSGTMLIVLKRDKEKAKK